MSTEVEFVADASAPLIRPAAADAPVALPLSAEQRDRWLACQFDPTDAPSRIDLWRLRVHAPVERAQLEAAVREVTTRHDALRIRYAADGSGQTLRPTDEIATLRVIHAREVHDEAGKMENLRASILQALDRKRGPLAGWWWLPEQSGGTLVLAAHQLVLDPSSGRAVLETVVRHCSPGVDATELHGEEGRSTSFLEFVREAVDSIAATEGATEFWRQRLAVRPQPLELPADLPRPAVPSFRAGEAKLEFAPELVAGVRALASELSIAQADVLLAGWSALLHRLAESEHFAIGVAVPGRSDDPVGPLLRLRPAVVTIRGSASFREHAQRVARDHAELVAHVDGDVGGVVRELRWPRDPTRPWLWGVTFACETTSSRLTWDGTEVDVVHETAPHFEGDLALAIADDADGLHVRCRYNRDVFDPETVERWLGHYATLLGSATKRRDETIAQLDLLTPAQRHEIVVERNPARTPVIDVPPLLHGLFSASAARRADHPAILAEGKSMSYRALEQWANQVAHQLQTLGAGPDARVALLLDRSAEYAVATLGVLKAGAAFVPIDPEWPEDRQDLVLRDCAARVVITAGRATPRELPAGVRGLDLRTLREAADSNRSAPDVAITPENLAYIIYTSGSTGVPKGVMIDHRAAATHMASIAHVYRIAPDDRCLLFHSVAFDPAIEQLFAPWVVGATVFVRGESLWTGREFSEWVRRDSITAVTLPPLYWLQLLRDWEQEPGLAPVRQLRRVLVGGEPLPPAAVELWRRLGLTSIRLLNGYGPTECTVTATVHDLPVEPSISEANGRIPIGRPQGPVEAYVLDAGFQPQPIGVPGELCLAGPTLARGYLGRETLTQERFVPHPFRAGERMYRTGDRARWSADGTIDFCGRADRQVKVGGYRIEPGEIEARLGRIDGVSAAAVVVERETRGDSVLVAYLVPVAGRELDHEQLRAELAAVLPRYMVPARFVDVPELPRTINGKLDTDQLARLGAAARARDAEQARTNGESTATVARDEIAQRVAELWCAALGRTDVAPDDNFFDCGGHSLIAVAWVAQLERELGVRIALRDWLVEPTFDTLVRLVRGGESAAVAADVPAPWKFLFPINPSGDRPRLFLFAGGRGCDEDFVVLAALTRALGPDQPVWGVRVGGPDRLKPMHQDAYAMAADVAREIRAFQPDGPYHLAGECIGGLLAFEVTRLLEREGARVEFLGMINTVCPRIAEPARWWVHTNWIGRTKQTLPALLRVLRRSSPRAIPGHLRAAGIRIWHSPYRGQPPRPDGMPHNPKDYHYGKMLLRYRPQQVQVPITMFGCETFKSAVNVRRWSRHALGGVQLVPLLGNTTTCIREHARDSADRFRRELDGVGPGFCRRI